jgi:N-acetylglucosamine-6-phosphate deacetylase
MSANPMGANQHAIAAHHVFDGEFVRDNAAVIVEGEHIVAVVQRQEIPAAMPVRELHEDVWLTPGFIDIQVNGGGDVLFNEAPTTETIRTMVAAHRRFGTTALLPTLISDRPEKTESALAAVEALVSIEPAVLGIHLEGPFLSPEKAGVHNPSAIRSPTAGDLAALTARRQGVTLVTLAPERVPEGFIAKLTAAGVRVALGHSMATYAQTCAAMAEGLTGFTHLFNAMRPLEAREPGPIGAALDSQHAWYGLIVDGIHVAPAMLRLALRGAGRPILVTDAMPPVGGVQPSFDLYGETIFTRESRCTRKDGILAGAYLDMATAVRNCVRLLRVPLATALRFATAHPAQFIGLGDRLGRLAPGYRADMVELDASTVTVCRTWVAGIARAA